MAITNKSIRTKLNRIIEIKKMILPRLAQELHDLGSRLPYDLCNTFRSKDFPGLKVVISKPGASGTQTSWKDVSEELAAYYHIPSSHFDQIVRRNTQRVKRSNEVRISITKDKIRDLDNVKGYLV